MSVFSVVASTCKQSEASVGHFIHNILSVESPFDRRTLQALVSRETMHAGPAVSRLLREHG